jgi:hypothetical protein
MAQDSYDDYLDPMDELRVMSRASKEERDTAEHQVRVRQFEDKAISIIQKVALNDLDRYLRAAQNTRSERLISAFPSVSGGSYTFAGLRTEIARDAPASYLSLLHSRGMNTTPCTPVLIARAMKAREEELRALLLERPTMLSMKHMRHARTPLRAERYPEFFAQILAQLITQDPHNSHPAFLDACNRGHGFAAEFMLRAGVPFEWLRLTSGWKSRPLRKWLDGLSSNHQRIEYSYSHERLRDWLADRKAVQATVAARGR